MKFFFYLFYLIPLFFIFSIISCEKEAFRKSMEEGNQLINTGKMNDSQEDLKAAIKKYQEAYSFAISSLDKEYDALFNLGVLLAQGSYYSRCIEIMEQAYQINQTEIGLYNYWATCYANQAQISIDDAEKEKLANRAIEIYQKGLLINESNYQLLYGIGVVYGFILKNYEQSLNFLNNAYLSNNKDINTLFALGNINFQMGYIEESVKYYNQILELSKPDSDFYKKASENLDKIK